MFSQKKEYCYVSHVASAQHRCRPATFVDTKRRSIARASSCGLFACAGAPLHGRHGPRFEPWQLGKSLLPSGDLTWFWKITMLNTLGNSSANGPFSVAMLHFQGAYALYFILWLLMWQAQIIGCGSHGPFSSLVSLWKIVIFQGKLWDYQRMLLKMSKFTTFHINSKLFHLMVIFHGYPTIIQYQLLSWPCDFVSLGQLQSRTTMNYLPLYIYICIITIYIWIYLNCLYAQTYCYNYTLYIIIYIII